MTVTPRTTFDCGTCQAPIRHRPTSHLGVAFCCAGCAAGGPCTCSYDEDLTMTLPQARPDGPRWWMTTEAWSALLAELERLDAEVAADARDGIMRLPGADPERRRRVLREIRDGAVVDDHAPHVGIGRCVTVSEDDGTTATYCLVLPGSGDPGRGQVSADSPLGSALLGASVGDVAEVEAPAGTWSVHVVRIA